jgi:hypothetical protein
MVKQIVYGLCYGMGSGRMAAALDVSELRARELSEDFKGSHPALTAWMQVGHWAYSSAWVWQGGTVGVVERARQQGHLQALPSLAGSSMLHGQLCVLLMCCFIAALVPPCTPCYCIDRLLLSGPGSRATCRPCLAAGAGCHT